MSSSSQVLAVSIRTPMQQAIKKRIDLDIGLEITQILVLEQVQYDELDLKVKGALGQTIQWKRR